MDWFNMNQSGWGSLVSDFRLTYLGTSGNAQKARTVRFPRQPGDPGEKAKIHQGMLHHRSRIRGFAPRLLRRFAFVLGARLTGASRPTLVRFTPAADRTPIRSLLQETYDTNRSSQKTLVNEVLTVSIDRPIRAKGPILQLTMTRGPNGSAYGGREIKRQGSN
jgi:hypothetical protein